MGQGRAVRPKPGKAPTCCICGTEVQGRLPVCKPCRKQLDAWRAERDLGRYRLGACVTCNSAAKAGSATCARKKSTCRQRLSRLRTEFKSTAEVV